MERPLFHAKGWPQLVFVLFLSVGDVIPLIDSLSPLQEDWPALWRSDSESRQCHQRVSQMWPSCSHTCHISFISLLLMQSRQRMGRGHRDELVREMWLWFSSPLKVITQPTCLLKRETWESLVFLHPCSPYSVHHQGPWPQSQSLKSILCHSPAPGCHYLLGSCLGSLFVLFICHKPEWFLTMICSSEKM